MRVLIIRHGESEADLLDVHEGRADFELTKLGREQAERMAIWVKDNYKIDRIYASTLKRAKQTAIALSQEVGIPIEETEYLMEFNNGLIAGLARKEAAQKYPEDLSLPIHESVYEMESLLEFRFRGDYILSKILSENNSDATVAIVSHGGMINQLYRSFLRLPVDSNIIFPTSDTGIHSWSFDNNRRVILFANSTKHLI
ncbi:MAG: histidine phosphatase family protein [Anaerocolumna aminovalerica]|uniref:histidine phosphatase family protein n=1 Tax=Anaerocolumna aminovalerica TaxID=1527 RepID=UPI000BE3E92E|nr:histidine phosphatase family protein [Anaerocolumna aminovalerica]MBU5333522.1 histidine phosphatase family protein [Anaerocolumna aminovalerica]MDU6264973.1 histidine phosphatase family protein [Anaerocolumna aminovalerica]